MRNPRDSAPHCRLIEMLSKMILERLEITVYEQEVRVRKPSRKLALAALEGWIWVHWNHIWDPPFRKWEFRQVFYEALNALEETRQIRLIYGPSGIIQAVRLPEQTPRGTKRQHGQVHLAVRLSGEPEDIAHFQNALGRLVSDVGSDDAFQTLERLKEDGRVEILDVLPQLQDE